MKGGTLFSGIGTPELAGPWIDWRWSAEIDPFASAVHAARFPNVPNLGDVREFPDAVEPVELIVFGSPCQSFSVAGKRAGLDDPRGNMALIGLQIVERVRPDWVVFENVPGLLSSDEWRDFGTFLGALGECGYGFAYRILDAQYAGVPQRRRRVFVVGHLGDWRPPAAVLFERDCLSWNSPPSRKAREGIAGSLSSRATAGGGLGTDFECGGGLIPIDARNGTLGEETTIPVQAGGDRKRGYSLHTIPLVGPLAANGGTDRKHGYGMGQQDYESGYAIAVTHSLRADGFDASEDGTGRGTPIIPIQSIQAVREKRQNGIGIGEDGDPLFTLTGRDQHAIAFEPRSRGDDGRGYDRAPYFSEEQSPTINAVKQPAVAFTERTRADGRNFEAQDDLAYSLNNPGEGGRTQERQILDTSMSVRRLTPRECERLQGFPDDFTLVRFNGKAAADGPRYRALGNAMAVPVIGWILRRVKEFAE